MSVNRVILVGRLGTDPDSKALDSGTFVCNMSLATSKSWTDKDGAKQEKTEWHRISVWGKQAENCAKYLKKGSQVYVEGEIQTDVYEKDGEKKYATKIKANNVTFLGGKSDSAPAQDTSAAEELGF